MLIASLGQLAKVKSCWRQINLRVWFGGGAVAAGLRRNSRAWIRRWLCDGQEALDGDLKKNHEVH